MSLHNIKVTVTPSALYVIHNSIFAHCHLLVTCEAGYTIDFDGICV